MKSNDFDRVAIVYDHLARFIFGRSIQDAQLYFASEIKSHSRVLIMGGGTGWIAEELMKIDPEFEIVMIDASQKMIDQASKRNLSKNVTLICGDEQAMPFSNFNVLITPFFLDMFEEKNLEKVISILKQHLTKNSLWIAVDFVSERWWHKIYLWIMYRFFKITCSIEASTLPPWEAALKNHLTALSQEVFYQGFVKAALYQLK